eukprot:gene2493-5423_t
MDDVIAGTVGGCALTAVGHPLDTIKTHPNLNQSDYLDAFVANSLLTIAIPKLCHLLKLLRILRQTCRYKLNFPTELDSTSPFELYRLRPSFTCLHYFYVDIPNYTDTETKPFISRIHYTKTLTTNPIRKFYVRLQTQSAENPVYRLYSINTGNHSSTLDCARKTWALEGIQGFYKGVTSPLAGQMLFRATLFFSYGQSLSIIHKLSHLDHDQRLHPSLYFVAGGMTGLAASFVENPIDLFKSQVQTAVHKGIKRTVSSVARQSIAKNGIIRGPYQALQATIVRNVPANAAYFGVFELGRSFGAAHLISCNVDDLPVLFNFASGSIAGLMYWVTTYPADVVKSVLMSDDLDRSKR